MNIFASRSHYIDHLAPVWNAMAAGEHLGAHFFVPVNLVHYAEGKINHPEYVRRVNSPLDFLIFENKFILVAGTRDIQMVLRAGYKHVAFMEHGVGITYGAHSAYAGGRGERTQVELFLAPNEIVAAKTEKALPGVRQVVVGTPKMDVWKGSVGRGALGVGRGASSGEARQVVALSFHWDGSGVAPEAGSAFAHFKRMLPVVARWRGFEVIGHGHPRAMGRLRPEYEKLGIELVEDFEEVMRRADVYVCDNSSTIYEFCVTDKPVVLLNAPEYRKKVHWGIRFWDYTDVGPCIDDPNELLGAILLALASQEWDPAREKAVRALYPFLGRSAGRAAEVLRKWERGAWGVGRDGVEREA